MSLRALLMMDLRLFNTSTLLTSELEAASIVADLGSSDTSVEGMSWKNSVGFTTGRWIMAACPLALVQRITVKELKPVRNMNISDKNNSSPYDSVSTSARFNQRVS